MIRDCWSIVIMNHGVKLGIANIDANGHVDFTQILDKEDELMDSGEVNADVA